MDTNVDFQSWLVAQTKFSGRDLELVIEKIWHQRWWRDSETKRDSETDIFLVFKDKVSSERVALHIENKLSGGVWTTYQAENYSKRAAARMKAYDYSDFQTVLIAPEEFISAWPAQVSQFQLVVTHESISRFVPEFGGTPMS